MKKRLPSVLLIALAATVLVQAPATVAADRTAGTDRPAPAAERPPVPDKARKMKKRIKMHEPMTTPMAKPGVMKQDMHEGMMQKDAEMKDMMDKEAKDMQ